MSIPYNPLLKPSLGTPLDKGHSFTKGLVGCWLKIEGWSDDTLRQKENFTKG